MAIRLSRALLEIFEKFQKRLPGGKIASLGVEFLYRLGRLHTTFFHMAKI